MRALFIVLLALALGGCSNGQSIPQVIGGLFSSNKTPTAGQWTCYSCSGMSVNSNGSFTFPGSGGAVGYIYTAPTGNPLGKTITLTYTVSGSGTVLPSPASGAGNAQVRLFIWRNGDDMQCTSTTEWFREWAANGAGPLTVGTHTISAIVSDPGWTDCLGKSDANQLAGVTANLQGIGFTFGAEFYGHGVFSTGSNSFTVNSFTVQ